jgi:quinol-cytochrome oxidoreductase complex cytochrome b subunit
VGDAMKSMKFITSVLTVCITIPIWFYLLYKILRAVEASDLMWFLFWVYVPFLILVLLLKSIMEGADKKP